ncbi:MAG: negative regulator,GrlR, partial [Firmicutes bacterium]|nr:negative regulator,GrlR [Bacillota bacterium]
MLKGIWSFSFKGSNIAFNTGVMFFVGDRFYGGSSHYYTIGKFEQEGLDIAAKVE